MITDYEKQAADFLTSHNLEFRAVLVGNDCPRFCEDEAKGIDIDKISTFPRKTHIHGKHYRCTISGKDRGHVTFDFWNSYADEEFNALGCNAYRKQQRSGGLMVPMYGWERRPLVPERINEATGKPLMKQFRAGKKTPTPYGLLACIEKNCPGDFEEFCGNYGYDTDSRKAEETWREVVKVWQKVERFFTAAEMEQLQEIA